MSVTFCQRFMFRRSSCTEPVTAVTRVEQGRYLAEYIPRAKFVELAGDDHMPAVGNGDAIVDEIGEFLTGVRSVETDRVLATILFTDIVRSPEHALALGDR